MLDKLLLWASKKTDDSELLEYPKSGYIGKAAPLES